ncbi:MAG: SUMF1/EgtB/PvdO family nonheme iron enzyme [Chloroflexota bacterium]
MSTGSMPETFGRNGSYKVVSAIGRGGFATVYKAYHEALDRYVAIKVLHPGALETEGARARFEIEGRASARLAGHPNIVQVYDFVSDEGKSAYLIMQFVEGETLETRLGRPIATQEIDAILSGIASALDYAHRHGVLHRDIKPSNVLLDADGTAVLTDFGIAKVLDETGAMTQFPVGTPYYMSPEQITGAALDGRSDVYSLGVVAYRIFSGRLPFQGAPMVILNHHVHSPVPPMSTPERPVPAGVEQVIQKALAKLPRERYQTAGQMVDELRAAVRPLILAEQAQEALREKDVRRAEGLVAELIRDHPSFPSGHQIQREVGRLRARIAQRNRIEALMAAENWQAAAEEIERGSLRADDDSGVVELVRRADAGLAAARARLEAARRAEQERQRQEALERERKEREAREAALREQEAREAARREWEAQEAARREREAREAARRAEEAREAERREREAREAARREWEAQEARRREQERLERERQEAARLEAARLEAARQEQARLEAAHQEQARRAQAEEDEWERERARQESLNQHVAETRELPPADSVPGLLARPGMTPLSPRQTSGQQLAQVQAAPQDQERLRHDAVRQARLDELAREVDEEAGLPPEEIAARAAERQRRTIALRVAAGLDKPPGVSGVDGQRPKGSPVVAVLAVVLAVAVLAGAAVFLVPGVQSAVGLGAATPAAETPTARPTLAAEAGSGERTATPAPATLPPTAGPAAKPTSNPPAATVVTSAPTTLPTAGPAAPAGQPTEPPQPTTPPTLAPKPTAPPPPLPTSIAGKDGAELRLVPAGPFTIGDDADSTARPSHSLTIPAFYIDVKEVTNALFARFVEQTGYKPQGDWRQRADPANFNPADFDVQRGDHPVVNVSWNDANAYCQWAGGRLPFEAEWEKAARGTDGRRWAWGNDPHPDFANVEVQNDAEPDTKRVGSMPKDLSPFGIFDMTGNVREWTNSERLDYPLANPTTFKPDSDVRMSRGASWLSLSDSIELTHRLAEPVGIAAKDLGFRCAVSADQATRR